MVARGTLWVVLAASVAASGVAGAAAEAKTGRHAPEFVMHSTSDGVWHWAAEQVFSSDAPKPGSAVAGLACNDPKANCRPRPATQEAVSDHVLGTVDLKPAPVTNLRAGTQAASAAGILARALSRRGARRALKATAAAVATWAATRGLMLLEPARPSPAAVPFVEAAPLEAASTPPAVGADSELGGAPEAPYWGEQLPTIGRWVFVVALILTAVWRRRAAARPELRRTPKVVPTLTPTSSGASSPRSSRSVLDAPALATPVETPLQTPRSKGEDHGDKADDLAPAQTAIKNVLLRWGLEAYTSAVLATTVEGGHSQDAMIAELRRAYWARQSSAAEFSSSGKDAMLTELRRAGWASQSSTAAASGGAGEERDLEKDDEADGWAVRSGALGGRGAEKARGVAVADEEGGRGGRPSTPREARSTEKRQVSRPSAAGEASAGGKGQVSKKADAADGPPSRPSAPQEASAAQRENIPQKIDVAESRPGAPQEPSVLQEKVVKKVDAADGPLSRPSAPQEASALQKQQEKVSEKVDAADGPLSRPSAPQEASAPQKQQEKVSKKADTADGLPSQPSTPQEAGAVQRERTLKKAGTAGALQEASAMQRVNLRRVNSTDGRPTRQSTPGEAGATQRELDAEVTPKSRRNFTRPSAAADASVLEKVRYFEKVAKVVDDQDGQPGAAGEAGGSEKPHSFPEGDNSSRSRASQPGDAQDARGGEQVRDSPKADEASPSQPSAAAELSADRGEDFAEQAKAEDKAQAAFCTPSPAGKAGKAHAKRKQDISGNDTATSTAGQSSSAREAYVERSRGSGRADRTARGPRSAREACAKEEEEEEGVDLAECMGPPSSAREAYVEFEQALQDQESEQESPKEDSRLTSPDRPHSISTSSGGRGRAPSISSVGSACEQYSMCSEDSETPETASEADVEDPFLSFEERFGLKESPDCQRFSIHSDSDSDDADAESSEEGPEDEEDETSWRPGEEA